MKRKVLNYRDRIRGFTLIEIMVVLVIMAIITTIGMLSLHFFNRGRQVTMVAEQLKEILMLAESEALLRPCTLGAKITPAGIQFYLYEPNHHKHIIWKALPHDTLSRPNIFPSDIRVKLLKLDNQDVNINEQQNNYLIFSSNGEITSFSLMITDKKHDRTYLLNGDQTGSIHLHQIDS